MKPPAILLLGILIFATTTILTNGTVHINSSSVGRKANKNPNITLQTATNSIVQNRGNKQPISLHTEGNEQHHSQQYNSSEHTLEKS